MVGVDRVTPSNHHKQDGTQTQEEGVIGNNLETGRHAGMMIAWGFDQVPVGHPGRVLANMKQPLKRQRPAFPNK